MEKTNDIKSDRDDSTKFWSDIWSQDVTYNNNAEWAKDIEMRCRNAERQEEMVITTDDVRSQIKKTSNWKACGLDGYIWIKNFSVLHVRITQQLDGCLQSKTVPDWMTKGKTCLILKDKEKGNIVSNFRPKTCLPIMWKTLTGIMGDKIYKHLEEGKLIPSEQEEGRRGCRGTKNQLIIDKMVLRNCRRRLTNLSVAWIDYKKAFDMVPHSWIVECTDWFGVVNNARKMVENSTVQWEVELTSGGETLGEVNIKRGMFQGDSLSPLLFVLAMIPMSLVLNKTKAGYQLEKNREKINQLLFMDDLKLYAKCKNKLDSLVQTVRMFSEDIAMQFRIKKCAIVEMKRGRMVLSKGIALPNGETIKSIEEEEGYKYLCILECDKIKSMEMKNLLRTEYFRKILKSKLNSGNVIHAISSRAVSIIRYEAGIIDWTVDELKGMDRKTRKMLTIYKNMHPRDDADKLYWKRAEGRRGVQSVKRIVEIEEASLGKYIDLKDEVMLKKVRTENVIRASENSRVKKKVLTDRRKAKFLEKKLHPNFWKATEKIRDEEESWCWVKKGNLKKETEGVILGALDQALRTNWVKNKIDREDVSPKCGMCGERDETIPHIVSECSQLAQNDDRKIRHDKVAALIHWDLCRKSGFPYSRQSYEHFVNKENRVLENKKGKNLIGFFNSNGKEN